MVLSDGSEFAFKGQVNFINRQVAASTGTIQVNAVFPNPGNVLRPGQYARIRAATKIRPGALLVPQRSINEIQGVRQVAVVSSDGTVSVRTVKTGERVGSDWIIEEGVSAGDRVVVEGLQKIRDGMKVTQKLFDPPVAKKSATQSSSANDSKGESESAPEKKGH
jgi:membrane fusion protein (multidrug efflux system)